MAMTCPDTRVSHHHFRPKEAPLPSLPRLIERVFEPHSTELLDALMKRSFDDIERIFFRAQATPEVVEARAALAHASHTTRVAVFFLLLNVDTALKDFLLQAESESRRDKVTRFFLDLRQHAVPAFLGNDTVSVLAFVQSCRECYLLA